MKALTEHFTDKEFTQLKDQKGDRSWRTAILEEFGVTSTEDDTTTSSRRDSTGGEVDV